MNPNQTLQILDRMSRLDPVYQNRNLNAPNDPFLEGFAFGHQLRQNYLAEREARENQKRQREIQDMYLRSHKKQGGGENPVIGSSIPDSPYPVNNNSIGDNPLGGTGYFAKAIQSVDGNPSNKYTFNESDYIPSAENGYHLGNYKQTEMYGDPTDFQRQMAANAIGYNLGSLEPRQQTWFPKDAAGGQQPDNTMNITSQPIGWNYNGRIDGQVGGLGIPQKPQVGFGTALTNAEQPQQSSSPISNVSQAVIRNGGKLSEDSWNKMKSAANPQEPSSDNARALEGKILNSATLEDYLNSKSSGVQSSRQNSNYLGDEYEMGRWMRDDEASGVTNPLVRLLRYQTMVEPLRESAREDELRNAFFVLQNPESSAQDKMNAISLIQYYKKDPYMAENQQMKRDKAMYDMGYLPEGDFGYGDADGGEYGGEDANAGAIYSHLASKGVPANVIAGIMGNLQAESGFNSSAVGDNGQSIGLAQWYDSRGNNLRNFAQQRGKDWTDIPTQVDFLLSEIQQSNPDLLQRMSKLSPHDAAILFHDEFEKSADSPEMKDRRGQYAEGIYGGRRQGSNRNGRYRRDPYRVSQRERFDYAKRQDAMNYALRNRAIDARLAAKVGTNNGKINSANGLWSSDDDIIGIFNKGALKENPKSGQAMLSIVGQFAPKYRELVQRGLSPEQAKGAIQAALIKQLGADNIANMGQANFNDMMDSIINGTSSVAQQKNNSGHGGASGSNDGSVIDNVKAKGWDVIKNMIPQNRENLNPDPYRDDVEDTAFEKADARRRVIEAARKEGLEFDEYTNELRPIGGRWGNLFNSREKQEEINRKIASFKSRYAF